MTRSLLSGAPVWVGKARDPRSASSPPLRARSQRPRRAGTSACPARADTANLAPANFTAGTGYFRRQLAAVTDQVAAHRGPLILCGDFNTWRPKRLTILHELIYQLDLHSIDFALDNRRMAFGFALDHIFVRGLRHKGGTVRKVYSSDHNPLSVILGV